jgi:hypothetical protein
MGKCPGRTACKHTTSWQTKQHPKSLVTELCAGYRWREKWCVAVREETEWESVFDSWHINGSWNVTAKRCVEFLFSSNRFDLLFSPVWNIDSITTRNSFIGTNKVIFRNLGALYVCTYTYKNTLSCVSSQYLAQILREWKPRFEITYFMCWMLYYISTLLFCFYIYNECVHLQKQWVCNKNVTTNNNSLRHSCLDWTYSELQMFPKCVLCTP